MQRITTDNNRILWTGFQFTATKTKTREEVIARL